MRAIILAAGRGSRMSHLTDDRPKCLNFLAGKTLLDWQQDSLRKAGIGEIIVVGGYQHQKLTGDFELIVNKLWSKTNMVRSLCVASPILEAHGALISYSDIVYSPEHVKKLMGSTADIAITYDKNWLDLWTLRFEEPLSDAETFKTKDGLLTEIGAKTNTLDEIKGQYMGLLKISPTGWKIITDCMSELPVDKIDKLDMTSLLSMLLDRKIKIEALPICGKWCEADTGDDINKYEMAIHNNRAWSHDWRL